MSDALFIIDERTGNLTVAGLTDEEARVLTRDLLPSPRPVGCACPVRRVDLGGLMAPAPGYVVLRVFRL